MGYNFNDTLSFVFCRTKSNAAHTARTEDDGAAIKEAINDSSDAAGKTEEHPSSPMVLSSSAPAAITDSDNGSGVFKKKKLSAEESELKELASICKNYWSNKQQTPGAGGENVDMQFATLVANELERMSPETKKRIGLFTRRKKVKSPKYCIPKYVCLQIPLFVSNIFVCLQIPLFKC